MNAKLRAGRLMGARSNEAWTVTRDTVDMSRPALPMRRTKIAAEPQDIVVDASKTALLIVDMQNDFCAPGGWMDGKGIDISPNRKPIEPLKALTNAFRAADIPIVWVNWGVRRDLLNISPSLQHAHNVHGEAGGLAEPVEGSRSEVIAEGSWGARVVDEIDPGDGDIQIVKHRFSAFWDTETDAVLRNLGIRTLLIGGVCTDQCVMTTLEDANFLGYDTILVEDCCGTVSPDYCTQAVIYNVKLLFGFVTNSADVISGIGSGA
ncbi:MAG: cysteine hydrolase family protein [Flavobacteriaceae bacterium]